jgi:hypothetical protein
MTERRDAADYVRQVHESTQQYTRELLAENERLVAVVGGLHEERLGLEARLKALEERLRTNDAARTTLLEQIAQMEARARTFTARYLEVEQQNANLANLYVASYRLHGSIDKTEVLETLKEILINLVGSEEFVILERDSDGALLRAVASVGVDDVQKAHITLGGGGLGEQIARGVPYVAADNAKDLPVTACVPLHVGGHIVGAIVVYRLLSHKAGLEESDIELFNLLATHAATALYCSEIRARKVAGVAGASAT